MDEYKAPEMIYAKINPTIFQGQIKPASEIGAQRLYFCDIYDLRFRILKNPVLGNTSSISCNFKEVSKMSFSV